MLLFAREVRTVVPSRLLNQYYQKTLRAAGQKDDWVATIVFISRQKIKKLYRRHAGINKSTTVLAFPWQESNVPGKIKYLGEIYIAPAVVREKFAAVGVSHKEGLKRIMVHATLHLLDFDHGSAMTLLEEAVLEN